MAWTKIVEEDNRRWGNELLTYNSALQLFKELESESYFYELEPAEVLFVYNDPTHRNFPATEGVPDLSFLGGVRARMIYSEQGDNIDQCQDYKPVNPHITSYPVIGELVIAVSYGEEEDFDSNFYLSILSKITGLHEFLSEKVIAFLTSLLATNILEHPFFLR